MSKENKKFTYSSNKTLDNHQSFAYLFTLSNEYLLLYLHPVNYYNTIFKPISNVPWRRVTQS